MGSAPNSNSPFDRARTFMKHRKCALACAELLHSEAGPAILPAPVLCASEWCLEAEMLGGLLLHPYAA